MKRLEDEFRKLNSTYQVVILVAVLVFTFGLFGPSMVSSKSTFAVLIGIAGCVVVAIEVYRLSKPLLEKLK